MNDLKEATLQDVLNDINFVDELSARNPVLFDFLSQPENVLELVKLVSNGPVLSLPVEKQFRLCYLATEVLTSDIWAIQDALLQNTEALNNLYSMLQDEKSCLLPLTAGFFHRIIIFLSKWACQELLNFLKSKNDFVDCVLRQMDKSAIPDIVYHLLNTADSESYRELCLWLDEMQLVQKLTAILLNESEQTQIRSCQFLCGILHVCRSRQWRCMNLSVENIQTCALLSRLENDQPTLQTILLAAFSDNSNKPTHIPTLPIPILLSYLRNLIMINSQPEVGIQLPSLPSNGLDDAKGTYNLQVISLLQPYLVSLKSLLLQNSKTEPMDLIPKLGLVRIHIIRFLCYLMDSSSPVITKEIANLDFIGIIMELFFEYKWHSFLHSSFEFLLKLIVTRLVAHLSGEQDSFVEHEQANQDNVEQKEPLPQNRFHKEEISGVGANFQQSNKDYLDKNSTSLGSNYNIECNGFLHADELSESFLSILYKIIIEHCFIDRLVTVWRENEETREGKLPARRAGYMGHLRSIANYLAAFLNPNINTEGVPDIFLQYYCPEKTDNISDEFINSHVSSFASNLSQKLPKDVWLKWCNFIQNDLIRSNKLAYINIHKFLNSSSSSSSSHCEDFVQNIPSDNTIPAEIQRAYYDYCAQPLAPPLPEIFGYEENEFNCSRERPEAVIESSLCGFDFNLAIQEDTVNNTLFGQACNEMIVIDGEEVGDTSVGLPVVCVDSQPSLTVKSTTPAFSTNGTTPTKLETSQTLWNSSGTSNACSSLDENSVRDLPSFAHLQKVFDEVLLEDNTHQYFHTRESSQCGDEKVLDITQTATEPTRFSSFSPPINHQRNSDVEILNPLLANLNCHNLNPKRALAPGPTLSDGHPILSVGQRKRTNSSSSDSSKNFFLDSDMRLFKDASCSKSDNFLSIKSSLVSVTGHTELPASVEINDSVESITLMDTSTKNSQKPYNDSANENNDVSYQEDTISNYANVSDQIHHSFSFSSMFERNDPTSAISFMNSTMPRPIQPTVRSQRLLRMPLLAEDEDLENVGWSELAVNGQLPLATGSQRRNPDIVTHLVNGAIESSLYSRRLLVEPNNVSPISCNSDLSKHLRKEFDKCNGECLTSVNNLKSDFGGNYSACDDSEISHFLVDPGEKICQNPVTDASCQLKSIDANIAQLSPTISNKSQHSLVSHSKIKHHANVDFLNNNSILEDQILLPHQRFRTHTTLNLKPNQDNDEQF